MEIHCRHMNVDKEDVNFEELSRCCDDFNGADLRNVCTEAGLFAIRADRDYVLEEDFMKVAGRALSLSRRHRLPTAPLLLAGVLSAEFDGRLKETPS